MFLNEEWYSSKHKQMRNFICPFSFKWHQKQISPEEKSWPAVMCHLFPSSPQPQTDSVTDINTERYVCNLLSLTINFTEYLHVRYCVWQWRDFPKVSFQKQWFLNYLVRVLNEYLRYHSYSEDKQFPINLIYSTISDL